MEEKLWAFYILASIAWADGILHEKEKSYFQKIAEESFKDKELESALKILQNPVSTNQLFEKIPNKKMRTQSYGFRLISKCINIAATDGFTSSSEVDLIYKLGNLYRFDRDLIDMFIKKMEE